MRILAKLPASLLILFLFIMGCSDSSIYEPETPEQSNETNKLIFPLIPNELSVTKTINGNQGGNLILAGLYRNAAGRIITVFATLTIPANAFQGTRTITIKTDPVLPALKFTPAIEFDTPLNLNLVLAGLDLRNLGLTQNVRFVFMGDDGTIEPTQNDGVQIHLPIGALTVVNAKLPHFSRYGYTR